MVTIGGLRTGEAARLIGMSEQSVRAFVRAGTLKATRTPLGLLIDADDARRLADQRDRLAHAHARKDRR